jgi:hypothetical protein
MPYHIEQQGEDYCVVNTATDEVIACHSSEEQAQAQIRAINMSEAQQRRDEQR